MTPLPTCRGCGARIRWAARDTGGTRIALDETPSPTGSWWVFDTPNGPRARFVPPEHRTVNRALGHELFDAHDETCPTPARRRRAA